MFSCYSLKTLHLFSQDNVTHVNGTGKK